MKNWAALLLIGTIAAAPGGFSGTPDVSVTDTFIGSGGGAGSFSSIRAFDGMIGSDAVLSAEHDIGGAGGMKQAGQFVREFDYAVADAWTVASRDNVKLGSAPITTGTPALARSLIADGTSADGTFDTRYLFAHLFGSQVETQVMRDLDARYGAGTSSNFTQMGNRFFSDVAADVKS